MLEQYPHGIGEKYAGRLRDEVERSYEKWQASGSQPRPSDAAEAGRTARIGRRWIRTACRADMCQCATRDQGARHHLPP